MMGKGLLRSKMFWVNTLTGLAVILSTTSEVSFIPPAALPWLAAGLAIVNVLLRTITNKPITSVK